MIPKITSEALLEAQSKYINYNFTDTDASTEEMKKLLEDNYHAFAKKQPAVAQLINEIIAFHFQNTEGMCAVFELAIILMSTIDSLYIQDEIGEVSKLFNFDEDEFNKKFYEQNNDDPEEDDDFESPEDYLW